LPLTDIIEFIDAEISNLQRVRAIILAGIHPDIERNQVHRRQDSQGQAHHECQGANQDCSRTEEALGCCEEGR
jgi:hypothetical protein